MFDRSLLAAFVFLGGCSVPTNTVLSEMDDAQIDRYCKGSERLFEVMTEEDNLDCGGGFTSGPFTGYTEEECAMNVRSLATCAATVGDLDQCNADAEADPCMVYVEDDSEACNKVFACGT